jgi:GNAT superfamily N-acetyltransferase
MVVNVRPSRPEDGPMLQAVEILAGERFREVGLDAVADHEPSDVSTLAAYADAGRSWVAVDEKDRPIGYAIVDVVDRQAHLEQISVHPERQGEGVARALLERARSWAQGTGYSTMTLTTFTDVPWNRPLYEHLGFRVLGDREIGPELGRILLDEAAHGLDPATRVAMSLDLSS